MSLHDYQCEKCGFIKYDVLKPHKELGKCPECGFAYWKKLLSPRISTHFKGDGWTPKFYKGEDK